MIYYASWQHKLRKKTYIHKTTAGNDYKKSKYSHTHAITQNYTHSAKLLHNTVEINFYGLSKVKWRRPTW